MITNSLIPALTATTWLQMKKEDQYLLIQLLYQYSQKHYNFSKLDRVSFIQKKIQEEKLYQLRIQYLQKFLEKNYMEESESSCIERAKQILKKYEKKY